VVKMTSQFATRNKHRLGMTANDGVLDRYIETPNPGKPTLDSHLGAVEKPISTFLKSGRYEKVELIKFPTFSYLVREHKLFKLWQKSYQYPPDGVRAKQAYALGQVRWLTISPTTTES
jgi:hypothetical protein